MAEEEGKALPWPKGAEKVENPSLVKFMMVGNDDQPIMKIELDRLNELVEVNGESMPAVQGGTTAANAVALPAGPTGQNRWFDASWGYWKYNNAVLKNPLGTDGIPEGNDGMLYWNGTTETWSISKMQALPKIDEIDHDGKIVRAPLKDSEVIWTEIENTNYGNGSGYYLYNTGAVFTSTGRRIQLWEINTELPLYFSGLINGASSIAMAVFFDASMNYLGYQNRVETGSVTYNRERINLPPGTKYIGSGNSNASGLLKIESEETVDEGYKKAVFEDEVYKKTESDVKYDTSTSIEIATVSTNITCVLNKF